MDIDLDGTVLRLTRRWGELVCEFADRAAIDEAPNAGGMRRPRSVLIEIDARVGDAQRDRGLQAAVESLAAHETVAGIVRIRFLGGGASTVGAALESVERMAGLGHASWEWWVSSRDGIDGVDERIAVVADAWRGAALSSGAWDADLASNRIAAVAIADTAAEVGVVVALLESGRDVTVKLRPPRVGRAAADGDGISRLAPYVGGDLLGWEPWDELFDRILCEARRPLRVSIGAEGVRVSGAPSYMQDGWGDAEVLRDGAGRPATPCAGCRFDSLGCARIGYSHAEQLRRLGAHADAEAADRWFCKAKTSVHVQLAYIMFEHLRDQDRLERVLVEFDGKGFPLKFSR